jgi:hypothetical protein
VVDFEIEKQVLCQRILVNEIVIREALDNLPQQFNVVDGIEAKYQVDIVSMYEDTSTAANRCGGLVSETLNKYAIQPKCNKLGIVVDDTIQSTEQDISEDYCTWD